MLKRIILAAVALAFTVGAATAQGPGFGPGPGPVPDPWVLNGSVLSFNNGAITVPNTVPGGSRGAGTINAKGLYVNGLAVLSGFAATAPLQWNAGTATASLNYDANFAVVSSNLALASIASGSLLANAGVSSAEPVATTPSAWLSRWCSTSADQVPYSTGASTWACLGLLGTAHTWTGQQTFVAPILGTATGTSLALGGATIGADTLAVTGTITSSGAITSAANIALGGANTLLFTGRTGMQSPSDGLLNIFASGGGFGRINLGGSTSAFPAIKRNGTALNFRLADDTADTPITAAAGSFSGQITSTITTGSAPFVVASTTQVANLYAARAALADTVTTNANLTGDVTSVGNATTLANIPTAVPMAGSLLATNIVAPATPAAGKTSLYVDSTQKVLSAKNDAGTVSVTVVPDAGTANNYISAISAAGVVSKSRPACATLSDSGVFCAGTDAANLTGTVASARVSGSYAGITGTGTLAAGATGAGFTINFTASTLSGTVPAANLPTGTAAAKGILQGDGSTLTITTGTIACTTATGAQIGCARPDGSTITISGGVLTAIGGAATSVQIGTTTVTSGTTTRVLYNNAGTLGEYTVSGSGNVCMTTSCVMTTPQLGTPASGNLANTTGFPVSGLGGLGTGIATALAVNTGTAGAPSILVASGAKALATSAIASGACTTAQTDTATGAASTDAVSVAFNADPTAVTGYAPATTGMLAIVYYPTTNTMNFKVCNTTGASITPGAITINWRIVR